MKSLQPSMSAGEMAPGLHGRVDAARYAIGLKTCRNVWTLPTGGGRKRTGYIYRGKVKTGVLPTRLLPFIYSTSTRYLVEVGNLYMRFWFLDSLNRLVQLEASPGVPYEIVSPYATADLELLRITQSADVLYITHGDYQTRELRRLSPSTFELRLFKNRFGPFRPLNINDGVKAGVSATTGIVTVFTTDDVFVAKHVGALFYIEEQELRSISPWEPAQKNVTVGTLRRSDGKIYRASAVSSGGTFTVTGSVRPTHDTGRAWDGGKDVRSDGVNNYSVGIEWEYVNAGYGIVKLTGYTDAKTMTGLVISPFPASVVGIPSASGSWTFSGDGTTKAFSITGAISNSVNDYSVTIGGTGVQP